MPKVVDHDQRRLELARAALRVIARDGLDAATTRTVSLECGWSTGVLKHYFRSKDDLLSAALGELERITRAQFEAGNVAETGYDALETAVERILAGDDGTTRVWIAFIDRASTHPSVAAEWRHAMASWSHRWAALVRRGQADGSISSTVDADTTGAELHALVNGLRITSFFGAGAAPAGRIAYVEALRADAPHGG